jgi:hypothetical protein
MCLLETVLCVHIWILLLSASCTGAICTAHFFLPLEKIATYPLLQVTCLLQSSSISVEESTSLLLGREFLVPNSNFDKIAFY